MSNLPRLDEVFTISEATTRYIVVLNPLEERGRAYGPFGTEAMARQFVEKMKAQETGMNMPWSYADDTGELAILPMETPTASSMTGAKTP